MANASGTEEHKTVSSIFSAEIQASVRGELEMILESPSFAQSNRCKRFLSFVVQQTLSGHASELKERTIGIGVFDRAMDYDTGGDSIVRVTSNEVRKRISQFYAESTRAHSIQIDLPRGSYVPEFRILPSKRRNEAAQNGTLVDSAKEPSAGEISSTFETRSSSTDNRVETVTSRPSIALVEAPKKTPLRRHLVLVALLILLLFGGTTTAVLVRNGARNNIPHIWDSFQRSNVPVLICLGTHDIQNSTTPSTQQTEGFADLVLRKDVIPVDDVSVIASLASLFGKKGIAFRVIGAEQASLTDLRRQPVVLIGAADNRWTLRLTQDLRYRVDFVPPGQNRIPVATIVDTKQPTNAPWKLDYSIPMNEWKNDYAIVAREDDPTTGVPVLIDAGLGNDGSIAASELIASDGLTNALAAEPSCSGKSNFEAVIGTEIIDAKPGPPHILRLQCW